jgi:hypothetical protein
VRQRPFRTALLLKLLRGQIVNSDQVASKPISALIKPEIGLVKARGAAMKLNLQPPYRGS